MDKEMLRKWLAAGYIEKGRWYPTENGTPQGSLCKALHKPPYAKKVIMQSNPSNPRANNNFIAFYFA